MVDVDGFYQLLILRTRPHSDDPHLIIDNLMPTLIAAFREIWDDGHATGQLEQFGEPLAPNPYGPNDYPDWTRRPPPTT